MKARILLSSLVVLNLIGISNAALDWDITEDTTIDSGSYGTVTVDYQNPTASSVVSIIGGSIEILKSYESSEVEVNAGTSIGNVWATDDSTVNILGGTINSVSSAGTSTVDVHYLSPLNGSFVYAAISLTGTLNIHGYDFEWTHMGGDGDLSGYWMNGESITFHFRDYEQQGIEGINIIPEPCTFFIMGTGFIVLACRRKRI